MVVEFIVIKIQSFIIKKTGLYFNFDLFIAIRINQYFNFNFVECLDS
jgi:hypothetical protein